jgi:hypothetical protein
VERKSSRAANYFEKTTASLGADGLFHQANMVNKVMAAFVAIDALFAAMGGVLIGFSVVVMNTCFNLPTDGNEAARNLLYQRFPLLGGY